MQFWSRRDKFKDEWIQSAALIERSPNFWVYLNMSNNFLRRLNHLLLYWLSYNAFRLLSWVIVLLLFSLDFWLLTLSCWLGFRGFFLIFSLLVLFYFLFSTIFLLIVVIKYSLLKFISLFFCIFLFFLCVLACCFGISLQKCLVFNVWSVCVFYFFLELHLFLKLGSLLILYFFLKLWLILMIALEFLFLPLPNIFFSLLPMRSLSFRIEVFSSLKH